MAIPIYNSFKGRQNNVLEQKTTYQNEINVLELRVYLIMNYNGRKYKQKVNRYLFQISNKLWAKVLTLHSKDFLIWNYDLLQLSLQNYLSQGIYFTIKIFERTMLSHFITCLFFRFPLLIFKYIVKKLLTFSNLQVLMFIRALVSLYVVYTQYFSMYKFSFFHSLCMHSTFPRMNVYCWSCW